MLIPNFFQLKPLKHLNRLSWTSSKCLMLNAYCFTYKLITNNRFWSNEIWLDLIKFVFFIVLVLINGLTAHWAVLRLVSFGIWLDPNRLIRLQALHQCHKRLTVRVSRPLSNSRLQSIEFPDQPELATVKRWADSNGEMNQKDWFFKETAPKNTFKLIAFRPTPEQESSITKSDNVFLEGAYSARSVKSLESAH